MANKSALLEALLVGVINDYEELKLSNKQESLAKFIIKMPCYTINNLRYDAELSDDECKAFIKFLFKYNMHERHKSIYVCLGACVEFMHYYLEG